jgi:hypothetical protein
MSSLPFPRPARGAVAAALLAAALPLAAAGAQTDYYNTDAGRPLTVEDAAVIERHAFELQAAPVRLERARGGRYTWGLEPELAYGVLPLTQLEVGLPLVARDAAAGAGRRVGLAGVDVALLHTLNTETLSLPSFAVGLSTLLPAGSLAAAHAYGTVTAVATRTTTHGRVHLNAQATAGPTPAADVDDAGTVELSRWLAGVAVDRALALRSLLVGAELVARQPLDADTDVAWSAALGLRRQMTPRWALDAGVGRELTGDHQAWSLTVGTAYAFGVPGLTPRGGR